MSQKFDRNIKRIDQIFRGKFDDSSRRLETLAYYKSFLESNLNFPLRVTGIEDFNWEEFYVLGPGDKREYEMLKKTHASYTDIFSMGKIASSFNIDYGLIADVIRVTDKKRFRLPLADMKAAKKKSPEYLFLEDYSVWFINYQ